MNHTGNDYATSPRGFYSYVVPEDVTYLYMQLKDPAVDTKTWEFRKEVLALAKRCFGPVFSVWVKTHIKESNYLYGRRYDFLVDILNYLQTGKMQLSVENWYELLEDYPEQDKYEAGKNPSIQVPILQSTSETIIRWCSFPGGFDDMLCTLNVLFGEARTTDKPEAKITIGRSPLSVRPE